MALRAVLLDVDDTLVDTRGAFRAVIASVVATWLPHLDADSREVAVQHWVLDPGGHFRAYTRGEVDFATQRRRRAADLHEALPVVRTLAELPGLLGLVPHASDPGS